MATRIRTLNFLPEIFQTTTNSQFLGATLDQLVDQPNTQRIQGYVGSKFGYSINAKDYYVTEPTKTRTDYQLEPGVVFTTDNNTTAQDFISYPGILDALKLQGALTEDQNRLFDSQIYAWDSFTNLDPLVNFNQYYWIPEGPERVVVSQQEVGRLQDYVVQDSTNYYNVSPVGTTDTNPDPTITLLRGGTYTFSVNQNSKFWIQGVPGITGLDPTQTNISTRDIYGVSNNGIEQGTITFDVPFRDAQNQYILPGNISVDVVSNIPFHQLNGAPVTGFEGIDTITSLDGLTVLFYDTGYANEFGYISNFYDFDTNFDVNNNLVAPTTTLVTSTSATGNVITCGSTSTMQVGQAITFSGLPFGGINQYQTGIPLTYSTDGINVGEMYYIDTIGTTDWIGIGLPSSAEVMGSISGNVLYVSDTIGGALEAGQTIDGTGVTAGTKIVSSFISAPFDGYIDDGAGAAGTTLTVTAIYTGTNRGVLGVGTVIEGIGLPAGLEITGFGTGTGGIGTYTVSASVLQPETNLVGIAPAGYTMYQVDTFQTVASTQIYGYEIVKGKIFTATGTDAGTGLVAPYTPSLYYVSSILSSTEFTVATEINPYATAPYIEIGKQYIISYVGDTDFTLLGAASNTVGTVFTATQIGNGTGAATELTVAGNFVYGKQYKITTLGTTDFTLIGAPSNTIGLVFTCTGTGTGTGTALQFVDVSLSTDTGTMTAYTNQGLYEEGYYTDVNQNLYTITYIGEPGSQVISLVPASLIPNKQKITAKYGKKYLNRSFYRAIQGTIEIVPYISATLDTLYYQDGTDPNKYGIIKLIESNSLNTLNINTDILGKTQYTATNGVVFTNGLKVTFQGSIYPTSYLNNEYYVEGVGTAIELIPVSDLIVPESFTGSVLIPWDTTGYGVNNYEGNSYIPVYQDYITIARNSINKNAWSRSNRWFHISVIQATAEYNNDPTLLTLYATETNKAKRPIIEFYPNLKLFNSGNTGKSPVDFVDFRTDDALSLVAGQENYYPDVEVYTAYTATIESTDYATARTATASAASTNYITVEYDGPAGPEFGTTGFNKNDTVVFDNTILDPVFGGIQAGVTYYISEIIDDTNFTISETYNGSVVTLSTDSSTGTRFFWTPRGTTVSIDTADITSGTFQVAQYLADSTNLLPNNTYITSIDVSGGTTTLTVYWGSGVAFRAGTTVASLVACPTPMSNFALFDGARVVFAGDTNLNIRNKIFVSRFTQLTPGSTPVITLSEASDGEVLVLEQVVAYRGYHNQGIDFYFDSENWIEGQQKLTVNQPPLFDVFDENNISFGDKTVYNGSSFTGSKLFSYGIGSGLNDYILGFPLRFSSVNNVNDISFDVSINTDSFTYVNGLTPVTKQVNTGYVFNYTSYLTYNREIGWQTTVSPSTQYQLFSFDFDPLVNTATFTCDIAPNLETNWPTVLVYNNNEYLTPDSYTVTTTANSTTITLVTAPVIETVIQVLLVSTQVSKNAYYTVPINLSNNPLNENLGTVSVGELRLQYQSICINNRNITGSIFGSNNFRDLGNLVPYANQIIQNSASLVLPGAFMRKQDHNLFNALAFNNSEYIKYKTLLVSTADTIITQQTFNPSQMLDAVLDYITSTKTSEQSFFWSDMLPNKAVYITNTYKFLNNLDTSVYPLSRVYDFTAANYYGVLVYLTTTASDIVITKQLIKDVDYTVSADTPSLTITLDLSPNDVITIKEYNQTYGSYVPNTPTKLGLYPRFIPEVVLDSDYATPTYFIRGHDGSYNKLYGEYNEAYGILIDFRDQVLFEFEKRIYNNIKTDAAIPLELYEIEPGFFRTTEYTEEQFLDIYSKTFLDWIGANRVDYKTQLFNKTNQLTYNYFESGNKINKEPILQGYWRGVYKYYFDTYTPNLTPWEMIGYSDQPSWWETKYGPAPYTSDNLVLWTDMAAGYDYNNGNPVIVPWAVRPELLKVLPVDSAGNLVSPFVSIVGNYISSTFQRDWKIGDIAPTELSYRRSSSWPFDLMRILALTKPAKFFNLAVDVDHYKYNAEFNQYLLNNRSHLKMTDIDVYGNGVAVTSFINWIVDYEKQIGLPATENIKSMLASLDVRLIYRLAGFSDKTLLKFFVEKGNPNNTNASLLIPDESYQVLLYDNIPFDKIVYSNIVVQLTSNGGYAVYGNSQSRPVFVGLEPVNNGKFVNVKIEDLSVKLPVDYSNNDKIIPYGTVFYSVQEVASFIASVGAKLTSQGMTFDYLENDLEVNWNQMVAEFMYYAQTGWEVGSIVTLNPAAKSLKINKDSYIVQPLTLQHTNFVLNDNLYPILVQDLNVIRDGTLFNVLPLSSGDAISYGQFNISNFENGIVFNNLTLFDDVIYNLVTGLRQQRIVVTGWKTAEWNGTIDAQGFILNQDNIKEWNKEAKYTTGEIVKYKNKYWTALKIIQPSAVFNEQYWKQTEYDSIQKGLLPNPSNRAYESTVYYDTNKANLENDGDLLGFSLIGYRPREYMSLADLSDITQINVYQNLIKEKGTPLAASAFKGAQLPQGGIQYDIYENWAIKAGEFGAVLNSNYVEILLNETKLIGNPATVSLTDGDVFTSAAQQQVPLNTVFNYGRPLTTPNILPTVSSAEPSKVFPDAGYVNFNDVKMSTYYYSGMNTAVAETGLVVPITELLVRDYVWIANYKEQWQVVTPTQLGQVVYAKNNLNNTVTVQFAQPHNLTQYQTFAIVNFDTNVDGYYIATLIPTPNTVIINLTLNPSVKTLTGLGVAMKFQNQRVATPSDINSLPLLDSEFIKNTVWVDTDSDGSWAVYRKSINYTYENELATNVDNPKESFGSAVATSNKLGYLVGDATAGKVYRYTYNALNNSYRIEQILSRMLSFGANIEYADDTVVVTETATNTMVVYQLIPGNIQISGDIVDNLLIEVQSISTACDSVAISGDKLWIYVGDMANAEVNVYHRTTPTVAAGSFVSGTLYTITSVGTTDFTLIGAIDNNVGTMFVATDIGTGTGTATYTTYSLVNTISSGLSSTDMFGYSISTNYDGSVITVGTPDKEPVVTAGNFVSGVRYKILSVGTTDFMAIGAASNTVGTIFTATGAGTGTGTAANVDIQNWGYAYVYNRLVQTIEASYTNAPIVQPESYPLAWTPVSVASRTGSAVDGGLAHESWITTNASMTGFANNTPVIFQAPTSLTTAGSFIVGQTYTINSLGTTDFTLIGAESNTVGLTFVTTGVGSGTGTALLITNFGDSGIIPNTVYYIYDSRDSVGPVYQFRIKQNITDSTYFPLVSGTGLSFNIYVQLNTLDVSVNGTLVDKTNYGVIGNNFVYLNQLYAGDIVTVSGSFISDGQTLSSPNTPRIGVEYGKSVDFNTNGNELLVGAPFEISTGNVEGAVYRYTDGGRSYGTVVGTSTVNVTATRKLMINGYLVFLTSGDASHVATTINSAGITNIQAAASSGKLIITLLNSNLAVPNQKLVLTSDDYTTFTELGITVYSATQTILCPHTWGPTQFGSVVKFNEYGSFVASAPAGTRFEATTFDFVDNENDDDTVFDHNTTQFIDYRLNAGAVYMFDYLSQYNESLDNVGEYVYAQSVNATNEEYGAQPYYGQALDFNNNKVLIGSPNFMPGTVNGQVVVYENITANATDWSVYRKSASVVDIEKISTIQIFNRATNNTLINLDYIDPLQGKILGAARENIDFISNADPARYNIDATNISTSGWGAEFVGMIWFDTSTTRFVNYHQNDLVYNTKYWGKVFPGSQVDVYTWISSNVLPVNYAGPGTVYDATKYATQVVINESGQLTPLYFYWVKNTNIVFTKAGKTLADSIVASYIASPTNSGISYFAPLLPNSFGIYNSGEYIQSLNSILSLNFATGSSDDVAHNLYDLIRTNYADDFLPGLPSLTTVNKEPISLYAKYIDSFGGTDNFGNVVPDPFLPIAVQSGILNRPKQSFFLNRLTALKNYMQFANEVLLTAPFVEFISSTFLTKVGDYFDTTAYWEYVNYWAPGYSNDTKATVQVQYYADLATLTVDDGTIATVAANGTYGLPETYIYNVATGWTRIGVTNGTFQIKSSIWNYADNGIGFGNNFYDTVPFDTYPSEETKYIIRAFNEEFPESYNIYRNKALVLMFEYIQAETIENQNYLTWLNKTSLVDVTHTIRELLPYQTYKSDNQDFLAGYINEVKPYHVVIKDFLFKYTGTEVFGGDITDFDLPSKYNTAYEEFISPQLVYANQSNEYQYLPTSTVWDDPSYSQWFANYGLSLAGQSGYQICSLTTYIALNSKYFFVDNSSGLPSQGTLLIGTEKIGYTSVDRSLNIIGGLIRGVDNTDIATHVPGTNIYIDLPGVIILDVGRGYTAPPRVIAYTDPVLYPAPRQAAILEPIMAGGQVIAVNVVDPGAGYVVTPTIQIDPAFTLPFDSTQINETYNTIKLYAPFLETGDIIQYKVVSGTVIAGLEDNQWYYINVLETSPLVVVALYSTYHDAINDTNRVRLSVSSVGTYTLNQGARANAIVSSTPTRENIISLRYDRTSYNPSVLVWRQGEYYGAYYAGLYNNTLSTASSSIKLESTQPPIDSILASAQGVSFEIVDVRNDQTLLWSSLERDVEILFNDITGVVRLTPKTTTNNASGSTLGMTVGMPVQFKGITSDSGVQDSIIYYVAEILSDTDFSIALSGPPYSAITFSNDFIVGPSGLKLLVSEVINKAVLTVYYPGITTATQTTSQSNTITVPLNLTGTGGTNNFYIGMPVFFTGSVFGGIVENDIYYVNGIVDNQNFIVSASNNAFINSITETIASSDAIVLDVTNDNYTINEPIIFSNFIISGSTSTTFGNLVSGTTYYIVGKVDANKIQVSTSINGSVLLLSDETGSGDIISQKNAVQLSTATGSMTLNINLPVSPGQINGQLFDLYQTSIQYPDQTGTIGDLLSRTVTATLPNVNRITFDTLGGGLDNIYSSMPILFTYSQSGSFNPGQVYYVKEYGTTTITSNATSSSGLQAVITASITGYVLTVTGIGGYINIGATITGTGVAPNTTILSFVSGSGYPGGEGDYIISVSQTVASISMNAYVGVVICNEAGATDRLYVGMPITFTGAGIGGVNINQEYFVAYIDPYDGITFALSNSVGGAAIPITNGTGTMSGLGDPWMTISMTLGGPTYDHLAPVRVVSTNTFTQTPESIPTFDVSYIMGGYRVLIAAAGTGFAVNNTISIDGANFGGTSANNLTLTVNTVNTDDGSITNVICSGQPPGSDSQYYLKVVSPNELEIYSNQLMTVPVSGIDLPYVGITSTTVTTMSATTIFVDSVTGFNVNDAVVFTGNVTGNLVLGTTYYIVSINTMNSSVEVSEAPEDEDTVFTVGTVPMADFIMAKTGDYAVLPEPFYFNQSIVKYNNQIYVCVISNNDDTFVPGKWELLTSSSRKINALDRIIGYYAPTDDMPGVDISQLVTGTSYPNSVYLGNAFQPDQQFELDTILASTTFYATQLNLIAVTTRVHQPGVFAVLNTEEYSGYAVSSGYTSGQTMEWQVNKLSNFPLNITNVKTLTSGKYIITTGNYPNNIILGTPEELLERNITFESILTPSTIINDVVENEGVLVAVGDTIMVSVDDGRTWTSVYTLSTDPRTTFALKSVTYASLSGFTGYVAVGSGQILDYSSGLTQVVDSNGVFYSTDGYKWNKVMPFSYHAFTSVTTNGTNLIAVGENNVIYTSLNGSYWTGVTETNVLDTSHQPLISNSVTSLAGTVITLGSPVNFLVDDAIIFAGSIKGNIVAGATYYVKTVNLLNDTIEVCQNIGDPAFNVGAVATTDFAIDSVAANENVSLLSTTSFSVGDKVQYYGTPFGGLENNTTYYVVSVDADTSSIQLSTTLSGSPITVTTASPVNMATITKVLDTITIPADFVTLNDVYYSTEFTKYISVGDSGFIFESTDGLTWNPSEEFQTVSQENLYGIVDSVTDFVPYTLLLGNNNSVVASTDPETAWDEPTTNFVRPEQTYNIQGDAFTDGYGPEELVPGVISDNITMLVTTRPGTTWPATEYAHVGYKVISREITPVAYPQYVYSFDNIAQSPSQIRVSVISRNSLSYYSLSEQGLYNGVDYTIDWVNKTVTLNNTLTTTQQLRIDVYVTGNGDQLVKSNTDIDPIRYNTTTEWYEIYLNCNYSASIFNGSGVIQPGTEPIQVLAFATEAGSNSIYFTDVSGFVLNDPITFQGGVFGNIQEDTTYYVKTISYASNSITVSQTWNSVTGTAGPTVVLIDATGDMYAIIQKGTGTTYTDPLVFHNGVKLVHGLSGTVTKIQSNNDTLTVNSTTGIIAGSSIVFSNTMFGNVQGGVLDATQITTGQTYRINSIGSTDFTSIGALTNTVGEFFVSTGAGTGTGTVTAVYFIDAIVDDNQFTISATDGGPTKALDDATGGAYFLTNDYAFGIQPNGIQATMIFAYPYNTSDDFITYTVFGETEPAQYGATLPECELFVGDGVTDTFDLANYNGGTNPQNAVVEVNGYRLPPSQYTIDDNLDNITFVTAPTGNVAVTMYNLTDRQYLSTNTYTGKTVSSIGNIENAITPSLAQAFVSATIANNRVVCDAGSTTDGFVVGQYVQFYGTSFGGVQTDGTVYTITSIINSTTFTINSTSLSNGTGYMTAVVGGQDTTRVTTLYDHNLATNDLVRIDGVLGSTQLNNNLYYVHVLSSKQFDIYYFDPTDPTKNYVPGVANNVVTDVSTYTGGGFAWVNQSYILQTTTASATTSGDNTITVAETTELVVGTPVVFMEDGVLIGDTTLGGIVTGEVYYVKEVFPDDFTFTISETRDGLVFALSSDTGTCIVTQWEQNNTDRLWVTVNGERIPSSSLRINSGNDISILAEIDTADTVIITSMMPSSTPDEETYLLNVNQLNEGSVYRANYNARTWLTYPLGLNDTSMVVENARHLIDVIYQTSTVTAAVSGLFYVGLSANRNLITGLTVFNQTTNTVIPSSNYTIEVISLIPTIVISSGCSAGDVLVISIYEGNLVYIGGEQIRFASIDLETNTISGLSRGVNGTGAQLIVPKFTEIYSLLATNRITDSQYSDTWNPIPGVYNVTEGDPLQIADTPTANFLRPSPTRNQLSQ